MPSIFTRIINGEIPCHKIAENEHCFAFLDTSPVAMGHTLVVPKQETDYIFDLNDEIYTNLMAFCKQIAPALARAVPCRRVGVAVIGLEVPHAHMHLVPLNTMRDLDFIKPKMQVDAEELAALATKIRGQLG